MNEFLEFISELKRIKSAISITGKRYSSIQVNSNKVEFIRGHKKTTESISLKELFELYQNEELITTATAKKYISGRVQSPAVAILNQLRQKTPSPPKKNSTTPMKTKIGTTSQSLAKRKKEKDETKFFRALTQLIGIDNILSKSVGKPITADDVFLSSNYCDFGFTEEINNYYKEILTKLKSNNLFKSKSLSHYIDCVIINHPILKTRIVEFDEEQHFTPARLDTLNILLDLFPDNYLPVFIEICEDKKYLNEDVLKKHRLKNKMETVPQSFKAFTKWLEQSNEKTSGYIGEKDCFPFLGGRIAQRAYYDCLRDTAHLSDKNMGFLPPLRFAKKTFEEIENKKFALISIDRIKEIITEILSKNYNIELPRT